MGADVSIAEGWYGTGSSILSNMANFSLEGEVGLHSLSANPMNMLSSYPGSDGDLCGDHFRLHFWSVFSDAFSGCLTYGVPVLTCIAALLLGCVTVVLGKTLAARLSADASLGNKVARLFADGTLKGKDRIGSRDVAVDMEEFQSVPILAQEDLESAKVLELDVARISDCNR